MKRIITWLKKTILPRVVFIPFWIVKFIFISFPDRKSNYDSSNVLIEAGVLGWQSIEFKEMYMSACEFLGPDKIFKLQVDKSASYTGQVKAALDKVQPTHYLYDPRTGNQSWYQGLIESLKIAFYLNLRGIVPIALLTDFSHRLWRTQSALVTAKRGVVITFLSARVGSPIFPHNRIVSPSLMPLSKQTMRYLSTLKEEKKSSAKNKAVFIGSLYEPRTTVLNEIKHHLEKKGFTLEILGRVFGAKRRPDSEYWSKLSHSDIILTTADQIDLPINDWQWMKHLTYRYLEAIAAGTLLIAPEVPGIRRFFIPGEHFVSFNSPEHAAEVIEYYLSNETERTKIALQGEERAQKLVDLSIFWVCIDIGLGKFSLT